MKVWNRPVDLSYEYSKLLGDLHPKSFLKESLERHVSSKLMRQKWALGFFLCNTSCKYMKVDTEIVLSRKKPKKRQKFYN